MSRFFPREYQFFPQSWTLPRDLGLLHKFLSSPPEQGKPPPTVIVKPNKGCQVGAPPRERGGESARARERERSRAAAAVRCGCARPGEPTPPRIIASRARTRLSHPRARLSLRFRAHGRLSSTPPDGARRASRSRWCGRWRSWRWCVRRTSRPPRGSCRSTLTARCSSTAATSLTCASTVRGRARRSYGAGSRAAHVLPGCVRLAFAARSRCT